MKPRIEIWTSNQNQEERHFFMPEEHNTYIWGYNPQIISQETADRIISMIIPEIENGRASNR